MTFGKSNVLIFVCRNTDSIEIPSFVTKVCAYAFSSIRIQKLCVPKQIIEI